MTFFNYQCVLVALFAIVLINDATDYCKKQLCPKTKEHIACKSDGEFGPECPYNASIHPMTAAVKKFIVDKHNEVRRGICEGNFGGLSRANRMIELEWDDELAELAEVSVRRCIYAHDSCRNTEIFTNVGQNIAIYTSKSKAKTKVLVIVTGILDSWLRQAKNCNMKLIESYRTNVGSASANEFTQMIQATCAKLGCAMVEFFKKGEKNIIFVCNYSDANTKNKPVYVVGIPCSGCKAGCSGTTPGLCKTEEHLLHLNVKLLGKSLIKLNIL